MISDPLLVIVVKPLKANSAIATEASRLGRCTASFAAETDSNENPESQSPAPAKERYAADLDEGADQGEAADPLIPRDVDQKCPSGVAQRPTPERASASSFASNNRRV